MVVTDPVLFQKLLLKLRIFKILVPKAQLCPCVLGVSSVFCVLGVFGVHGVFGVLVSSVSLLASLNKDNLSEYKKKHNSDVSVAIIFTWHISSTHIATLNLSVMFQLKYFSAF